MTEGPRRGVTRGYVGALILATLVFSAALVVATWGLLALGLNRDPVATPGVSKAAGPVLLTIALGALAWVLWKQAIELLRGQRRPSWTHIITGVGAVYLIWSLGGMLVGMSLEDTWLSPFSATAAAIWAVASLLFWAILTRRLYTDRPVPQWPWERKEEDE